MGKVLKADDLEVDMFVTVHTGITYKNDKHIMKIDSEGIEEGVVVIKGEDNSGKGDVHRIKLIELPYVILEYISNKKLKLKVIDIRRQKLMSLSKEFVMMMAPQFMDMEVNND